MRRTRKIAPTPPDQGYEATGFTGWAAGPARGLAEVAHDTRNMVTALGLYCELLEEPGVLSPSFRHYGSELRLLASASRRLVEKLMHLNGELDGAKRAIHARGPATGDEGDAPGVETQEGDIAPGTLIRDLARELKTNRNLLSALAGPGVALTLEIAGARSPVRMTSEDLTRILVNLVRNATEAMPDGGRLHLSLRELPMASGTGPHLLLSVEDNGRGIAPEMLERVFEPGFTKHSCLEPAAGWHRDHFGLGLSITRSIVEAAGGSIRATARNSGGVCFRIELPVRAC